MPGIIRVKAEIVIYVISITFLCPLSHIKALTPNVMYLEVESLGGN